MTKSKSYPIMEYYDTIQGEGFHIGKAALFIRLGGCDVECPWCDVPESWDKNAHKSMDLSEIEELISSSKSEIVVVTGGEPTMYDLLELTNSIHKFNKKSHIETSGTNPLTGNWDWITFSPKRYKKPHDEYYEKCHELKIVICRENDIRWAESHADKTNENSRLYLQPEWVQREETQKLIISHVLENPQWQISIQTHKYMGVE